MGIKYLDEQPASGGIRYLDDKKAGILQSLKAGLSVAPQMGKAFLQQNTPEALAKNYGPYLPVAGAMAGSAVAPGIGTAIGAGLGSIAGNMASIYGNDAKAPTTAKEAAKEAIINTLISGFPETTEAGKLAQMGKKAIAKTFEAVAGPKANIYMDAMKKGLKTYLAPSMEEATGGFEDALKKEGIGRPPVESRYDPQLSQARDKAQQVIAKLEAAPSVPGTSALNPEEALRGRQAVDRVIAGTPQADKGALTEMYKDRSALNDVLSNISGPLSDASKNYRDAIVKNSLLSPVRVTKFGKPSAFLTMLSVLDALGANSLKPLAYAAATGPAATGLMATGGADAARLLGKQGVRQAITSGILRRLRGNENTNQ